MALSVAEALSRILHGVEATPAELVGVETAHGRILADALVARLTQPPFDASAMDGYAVRIADLKDLPARGSRLSARLPRGTPSAAR